MKDTLINRSHSKKAYLIPFNIIKEATEGDIEAINQILKHYEGYISTLATRTLYDENGTTYPCVDSELKRRLETKLITRILAFKI